MFVKTAILICYLFLLNSCHVLSSDYKNNSILLNEENKKIYIKTRLVIERDKETKKTVVTSSQIIMDLYVTEKVFKPLGLFFDITKIEIVDKKEDWNFYLYNDSIKYKNEISIYYIFNEFEFEHEYEKGIYSGISSFPWDKNRSGIVIHGPSCRSTTLAHEIGHYFGLRHTFDEDENLKDTLTEKEFLKINQDSDYRFYNNIMNYSFFNEEPFVSPKQIQQVKKHLLLSRSRVVDWEKSKIREKENLQK